MARPKIKIDDWSEGIAKTRSKIKQPQTQQAAQQEELEIKEENSTPKETTANTTTSTKDTASVKETVSAPLTKAETEIANVHMRKQSVFELIEAGVQKKKKLSKTLYFDEDIWRHVKYYGELIGKQNGGISKFANDLIREELQQRGYWNDEIANNKDLDN